MSLAVLRDVQGWEGLYQVDEFGRVFSLPRTGWTPFGLRSYGGKELTQCFIRGYAKVGLYRPGEAKQEFVHKLVLNAFVGTRPDGWECRHLDGDKRNNQLANLQWGTKLQNAADKERHGTMARGSRFKSAKLTETDVADIRQKRESVAAQAARYGVSISLIRKVRGRECWRHL